MESFVGVVTAVTSAVELYELWYEWFPINLLLGNFVRQILIILSIIFSFVILSCGEKEETTTATTTVTTTDNDTITTTDTTAPVIVEVIAVTTPITDTTPDYTFSSDEAGTITYGGSCSSSTTSAVSGNNSITLDTLSLGTYSDCTVTVTDSGSNSVTLNMSSFSVFEQMGGSFQGGELSLSNLVTTVAGTGSFGSANGTGTSASFY